MNFMSILIYILISFFVAFGLVGISVDLINLGELARYVQINILTSMFNRTLMCAAGILIALVPLLGLLGSVFSRSRREKTIKYETKAGQVQITLTALEDMVRKCLLENDIISHIKPKVFSRKRNVAINVKLILRSEVNIKTFAEDIQGKIKDKIESIERPVLSKETRSDSEAYGQRDATL